MLRSTFEIGPIRPPSEAYSLLIRATRNCPWNKCRFCHSYKGKKFELRTVAEIKQDIIVARAMYDKIAEISSKSGNQGGMQRVIGMMLKEPPSESFRSVALWLYGGGENVFLQDANSLIMKTGDLIEVLKFLKTAFPGIRRITSYARSHTAMRKGYDELIDLREAGLSRLHLGLESGYDPLLHYMNKGVTAADHIKGGRKIVESRISLSEYVILGLGGKELQKYHALETARVLNEINPGFIRLRTLAVNRDTPLYEEVASSKFIRATDEEIIKELKMLIEHLTCSSNILSDHITNLLQEIQGKLPQDKENIIAIIERFQSLSTEERVNFKVGRRVGLYSSLDDMADSPKHELTEQIKIKLSKGSRYLDEREIYSLMEEFI